MSSINLRKLWPGEYWREYEIHFQFKFYLFVSISHEVITNAYRIKINGRWGWHPKHYAWDWWHPYISVMGRMGWKRTEDLYLPSMTTDQFILPVPCCWLSLNQNGNNRLHWKLLEHILERTWVYWVTPVCYKVSTLGLFRLKGKW